MGFSGARLSLIQPHAPFRMKQRRSRQNKLTPSTSVAPEEDSESLVLLEVAVSEAALKC